LVLKYPPWSRTYCSNMLMSGKNLRFSLVRPALRMLLIWRVDSQTNFQNFLTNKLLRTWLIPGSFLITGPTLVCSSASRGWWMMGPKQKLWRTSCQESERCMPHLHGEVIHKLFQTSEEKYKPVKRCIILWPFVFQVCLLLSLSLSTERVWMPEVWTLNSTIEGQPWCHLT